MPRYRRVRCGMERVGRPGVRGAGGRAARGQGGERTGRREDRKGGWSGERRGALLYGKMLLGAGADGCAGGGGGSGCTMKYAKFACEGMP